jgi:hypothetical protein
MSTGARRGNTTLATRPQPEHTVTHAALVDYLANGAVTELVLAETEPGTWRLEALLSWKPGRSVLTAARGGERLFRSLDTLASFLRTVGIGATIVRLELRS